MAKMHDEEPQGSPILKAVIGVLIVILIVSVLYPQSLWNKHEKLITLSQNRMENLNTIVGRFYSVNGYYSANLDTLLSFMDQDSIAVERSVFEFEQLALYDADYDSFLVEFTDRFHFSHIEFESFSDGVPTEMAEKGEGVVLDSVVMIMVPRPEYTDVVFPVKVSMTSDRGVRFEKRGKGVEEITQAVWSSGKINRRYMPYQIRRVPTQKYLLYLPLENLGIDPISHEAFELYLNARIVMEGKIDYTVVRRGEPDPMVLGDSLKTNLFINKLARKARSRLEQDMQRDTTLYEMQLELQSDYFEMELDLLRPGRSTTVDADRERMVPLDSVENFSVPERLQFELYKITQDSLIKAWTNWEKTQEILGRLTWEEQNRLASVTVVGVTICPPYKGDYKLRGGNLLDIIYSVGPVDNPGQVENSDLSWSETK